MIHRCFRKVQAAFVAAVLLMGSTGAGYGNDGAGLELFQPQLQRVLPLAVNELMASNNSFMQDPQGQFDDWIEIHNYGPDPINIGGLYLTDDLSIPDKWLISGSVRAAATIPAGGYLLIWADNDTSDSGLHANFKLSADGEEIGLFADDGVTLIDSITFGPQSPDVSFGRYPDGEDELRFFGFPSPGAANTGGYLGVVSRPRGAPDA